MSGLEFADGGRVPCRSSPFPRAWGTPPYDALQRSAWISAHLDGDGVRMLPPGRDPHEAPQRARRGGRMTGAQARLHLLRLELLAKRRPW